MKIGKYFERPPREAIHFGWGHGQYLDFWSIIHITSGIIIASLASLFGLTYSQSLIFILILAVLYEGIELINNYIESWTNAITDILLGVISAAVTLSLFTRHNINNNQQALVLAFAIPINITLLHLGWHTYLKRRSKKNKSHKYIEPLLNAITIIGALAVIGTLIYSRN